MMASILLALATPRSALHAQATAFPSRPIQLVVAAPAGGPSDVLARMLARGRRLAPLAITSGARSPLFPELPTVAESGFPGFEVIAWAGLSAPRGTPAAIIERIYAAAAKALKGPMRASQEASGAQVVGSPPAEYAAFVRTKQRSGHA